MSTKIEWCDETVNVVSGCTPISDGCKNCYARRQIGRYKGRKGWPKSPDEVTLFPERLEIPFRWKKPKRIFVPSMSDLFHKNVPWEYVAAVFGMMAATPQHTYLILTKREKRMLQWFKMIQSQTSDGPSLECAFQLLNSEAINHPDSFSGPIHRWGPDPDAPWPLSNVHLGVSIESQEMADARIPLLLQTPAAMRFVSCEPLLSSIDLSKWIKYNLLHETSKSRSTGVYGSQTGVDRNQGRRFDLENCPETDKQVGRNSDCKATSNTTSDRCIGGRRVPTNFHNDRRGTDALPSSPSCMAALQRPDSKGDADQSQEREQGGQQTSEFGDCDTLGKHETCCADRIIKGPGRTEECIGNPERYPSGADKNRICDGTRNSGGNSQEIPCVSSDNIGHSKREETQDSTGNNLGLHGETSENSSGSQQQGSISLIIAGAETGPGKRPMNLDWARSIRDQCQAAKVPFFFKKDSDGNHELDGKVWEEMPK